VQRKDTEPVDGLHTFIDVGATGMDAMAVALIMGAFIWASVRFLLQTSRHAAGAYPRYKSFLGRALSLGLEFLVAADVIRTVGVSPTFRNIGILGAIIVIRTALSWSLVVEMEGRWPWQPATVESSAQKGSE
jgi:uncharacterized membrane protein